MKEYYRQRKQQWQLYQLAHWLQLQQHQNRVSFFLFLVMLNFDATSFFSHKYHQFFLGSKVDEIDILEAEPTKKPPRRVLPEHEGRYKITLPAGTTERSKQILAKKTTCKPKLQRHFLTTKVVVSY